MPVSTGCASNINGVTTVRMVVTPFFYLQSPNINRLVPVLVN